MSMCFRWRGPGQFCIRGGILDVFGLTDENPVRVEFWGDEIDSIRGFEAESQRSIESLEEIRIYPASEVLLTGDVLKTVRTGIERSAGSMYGPFGIRCARRRLPGSVQCGYVAGRAAGRFYDPWPGRLYAVFL